MMRYCIWNNKGGMGKTFLTYSLATEYAIRHPEKSVVVVDMCPQANVSEMLLGGNGQGEENLARCYENNRTIASYIKNRYDKSKSGLLGNETTYFVSARQYNGEMPHNLYLLPGDNDLDICALLVDHIATGPQRTAWQTSRRFLDDILNAFENNDKKDKTVFIDTNPSFANYTQLSIIASNRIIVPCTADSASIRGFSNVCRLIYGVRFNGSTAVDDVFDTFSSRLQDIGLSPKVHALVLNKARTSSKEAAAGYRGHVDEIKKITKEIVSQHPECFTEDTAVAERIFDMKDCNTIAPVMSYNGLPPSSLRPTKYPVYEKMAQVNQTQIDPFLEGLKEILDNLD